MTTSLPHWYLLGAGNMGMLATHYLHQAGHSVTVLRSGGGLNLHKTLTFADGRPARQLDLSVRSPAAVEEPVRHLLVACKAPYTVAALSGVRVTEYATVLRLQNGLGSLDGQLPDTATLIEVVTTSAVRGANHSHHVVAENRTWMGGAPRRPTWFKGLAHHWPGLVWSDDIRHRQWQKLVANAVINPLTALHDVPNGRLLKNPSLHREMALLAAEADTMLVRIDPTWPGDSLVHVENVARATADNTSSMRADVQRGARTEIDVINGWLLRQAGILALDMPNHRAIVDAVIATRQPPRGENQR